MRKEAQRGSAWPSHSWSTRQLELKPRFDYEVLVLTSACLWELFSKAQAKEPQAPEGQPRDQKRLASSLSETLHAHFNAFEL